MQRLTHALRYWLASNNLPTEGVKLIIEFPDQNAAHKATAAVRQEILALALYPSTTVVDVATVNGIGLSIAIRSNSSARSPAP